jgi:hypothetical protein
MPVAIVLTLALLAQLGSASSETPATTRLPISLSHIRQALAKPARLHITPPAEPPTYRVAIREHPFFTEKPHKWDFGSGGYAPRYHGQQVMPSFTPPLFTVDLLRVARSAVKAIEECAAQVCD